MKFSFFRFTKGEIRGILWMLPLVCCVAILIGVVSKPRVPREMTLLADQASAFDSVRCDRINGAARGASRFDDGQDENSTEGELFVFDPNTIDYHGLRRLGFSAQDAAGIVRYRAKYSKIFEYPTDFAACYQVSDSAFLRLEPYIRIGARFVSGNQPDGHNRNAVTKVVASEKLFRFDPNTLDSVGFIRLGFSPKQVGVIIRYRDMCDGFGSVDDFAKCYCVQDRIEQLRPYIDLSEKGRKQMVRSVAVLRVNVNKASVAELERVHGIGALTAQRIVDYREKLGGFYEINQLAEVTGVTESNFERMKKEIFADSCDISKIDVNFASAEKMKTHPYMNAQIIRRTFKYVQLKGGLRNLQEMIEYDILSPEQAIRLAPYLTFGHRIR